MLQSCIDNIRCLFPVPERFKTEIDFDLILKGIHVLRIMAQQSLDPATLAGIRMVRK